MSGLRTLFVVLFICLVCFCLGGYLGSMYSAVSLLPFTDGGEVDSTIQKDQVYTAKMVRVVEGHVFDIYLENGKRYLVALRHVPGTPFEAKDQVVRYLNDCRSGGKKLTLVFRGWDAQNQRHLCEIYPDEAHSLSLTDWLYAKSMAYSR